MAYHNKIPRGWLIRSTYFYHAMPFIRAAYAMVCLYTCGRQNDTILAQYLALIHCRHSAVSAKTGNARYTDRPTVHGKLIAHCVRRTAFHTLGVDGTPKYNRLSKLSIREKTIDDYTCSAHWGWWHVGPVASQYRPTAVQIWPQGDATYAENSCKLLRTYRTPEK